MAQILSIYGLVTSVMISNSFFEKMALYTGFIQMGAGLAVGLCGMAAGFAIGIVGDAGGKPLATIITWHEKAPGHRQVLTHSSGNCTSKCTATTIVHGNGIDLDLF